MNTIAAYAQDMSEFLNESELTERRAFIETFVKEIVVMPGDALLRYTIPISQSTTEAPILVGGWAWSRLRAGSFSYCTNLRFSLTFRLSVAVEVVDVGSIQRRRAWAVA